MQLIDIELLFPEGSATGRTENVEFFEIKALCKPVLPKEEILLKVLRCGSTRDHITVGVAIGNRDVAAVTSRNLETLATTTLEWKRQLANADATDQMKLEVTISKSRRDGCVSIFDIRAFADNLNALSASEQFGEFEKLTAHGTPTTCFIFTQLEPTSSALLSFSCEGSASVQTWGNRKDIFQKAAYICHFAKSDTIPFVPEDFEFDSKCPAAIASIMEKLKTVLAIAFLVDRTDLDGNKLTYFLRGYKTISGIVDLGSPGFRLGMEDVYSLYKWMYSGGAISDKAGLVRNLLSLDVAEGDSFRVHKWIFGGVLSNYEIYLKANVTQYLEAKGKVETSVADLCATMLQCVDGLIGSFKGNLAGFFALFASVVISNATKNGNLRDIFTPQIILLGSGSVGVSTLYLVLSAIFLYIGVNRLRNSYGRLKARFSDVLVKEDIDRILQHDEEYRISLRQVRIGFYSIVIVWILMLLGVLLILLAGEELQLHLRANPFLYF